MVARERGGDVIDRSLMRAVTMVGPLRCLACLHVPTLATLQRSLHPVVLAESIGARSKLRALHNVACVDRICLCYRCWWTWATMCTRTNLSAASCRLPPKLTRCAQTAGLDDLKRGWQSSWQQYIADSIYMQRASLLPAGATFPGQPEACCTKQGCSRGCCWLCTVQAEAQEYLASCDCPEYLCKAARRLAEESERVTHYLDPGSDAKITRVVEEELIEKQARP